MTELEILKNNKLIANFMGYEYVGYRIAVFNRRDNIVTITPSYSGYILKNQLENALLTDFYLNNNNQNDNDLLQKLDYSINIKKYYLTAINHKTTKLEWLTEKLEYHLSWLWLMPVIDKIENLGFYVNIHSKNECTIHGEGENDYLATFIDETKIKAVHLAVCDFIKNYNI